MSFREKIFIDQLHKDAKITLSRLLSKRRSVFWGETPILFRIRKYKVAGEVRNQRVSVVKPQLHRVQLYSILLGKKVDLETTPQMIKFIEASGGLDDYLLKTPDSKLFSDVASQLKVQLLQVKLRKEEQAAQQQRQLNKQLLRKDPSAAGGLGPSGQLSVAAAAAALSSSSTAGSSSQAAGQQPPAQEAAGTSAAAAGGPGRGRKKDPEAVAAIQRMREQLARERRERITRMLQVAAAAGREAASSARALQPKAGVGIGGTAAGSASPASAPGGTA